jgi:prephenate dehydratase
MWSGLLDLSVSDSSFTAVSLHHQPATIACLGPEGSFSHLVAAQRFPGVPVTTLGNVGEVFDYLAGAPEALGIVPIENSSGGFIIDTVDRLVDERCTLRILEELALNVKLALLGRKGRPVEVIYSHAMPFFHSDEWLKKHYPGARRVSTPSTAAAAAKAAAEPGAAAIGPRQNAGKHALDLLHFPIAGEVPNITQFYLIGPVANDASPRNNRTALLVELPDRAGSLCRFLTPLSDAGVNMKRLESRPIRGQPNKYKFFIEIEGSPADTRVCAALDQTRADGATIRELGSYPAGTTFES